MPCADHAKHPGPPSRMAGELTGKPPLPYTLEGYGQDMIFHDIDIAGASVAAHIGGFR